MSKTKISQYDPSAANNTDVNGVNIAEGCAPSGINNAIREVMAALKRFETGSDGDSVTVGGNLVVSGSTTIANTATLGNVDINGGSIDGATIGAASAAAGNFTTVDTTNIEVTNIKAKDGTASITIADSTGAVSFANNVTLGDASTDTVTVNGRVGIGAAGVPHLGLFVSSSAILSGLSSAVASLRAGGTLGSDVTGQGSGLIAKINTQAAAFTLSNASGVSVDDASKGAGSTITNLHGLYINDQTQGTNNYGITSLVSSGTNKWNIYASGTADNYFAGNIGIGTSTPDRAIKIHRDNSYVWIADAAGGNVAFIGGSGSNDGIMRLYEGTGHTAKVEIHSNSVSYFNGGNVGIGTSSPAIRVSGTVLSINNAATAGLELANAGSSAGELFANSNGTTLAEFRSLSLMFRTNNTERMRIDSSGNVGIGTSSPANKLDIVDNTDKTMDSAGSGQLRIVGGASSYALAIALDATASYIYNNATSRAMVFGTNETERMRITSSGNVGIGTSSPAATLHVVGNRIQTGYDSSNVDIFWVQPTATDTRLRNRTALPLTFYTSDAERMRITSGGEVYIAGTTDQGAYNLQVNGTGVWGAGAYVNGSDERIKENIAPISSGLDVVEKLNPVTYRYKEDWSKDQSTQTGFIAQELLVALEGKNYVDSVVQQGGSEGYYSVAYQNIIPILTKAIQELKAELDTVKSELNQLKGV